LIALVAVKPFISEEPLHYILAFVGGIMLAGELWGLKPLLRCCQQGLPLVPDTFSSDSQINKAPRTVHPAAN